MIKQKHSGLFALTTTCSALFFSTYAAAQDTVIDFSQSQTTKVEITRGGTYRLTGSNDNAQLWVTAGDEEVTLILDNLTLSNDFGSAIYIAESGDVELRLAPGSKNVLSDMPHGETGDPEYPQNAPLYAKSDLKLRGASGATLTVNAKYKDGITSKDDLDFRDIELVIHAEDDAIYGKDSVDIRDSNVSIFAGDDGIKSDNTEREDKGFIYIEDSGIELAAKGDGINGFQSVAIKNSNIDITESNEGIESRNITIYSGDINIKSQDDAINVADGLSTSKGGYGRGGFVKGVTEFFNDDDEQGVATSGGVGAVTILDGKIHVRSGGDGFDSNGSAMMSGGELFIEGPTSRGDGYIDVDRGFKLTGGYLMAMGNSGMAQTPSADSTQPVIQINTETLYEAGARLSISQDNKVIFEEVMPQAFNSFTVSRPEFSLGQAYTVTINGEDIANLTLSSMITTHGEGGRGGKGGRGNKKPWWKF